MSYYSGIVTTLYYNDTESLIHGVMIVSVVSIADTGLILSTFCPKMDQSI